MSQEVGQDRILQADELRKLLRVFRGGRLEVRDHNGLYLGTIAAAQLRGEDLRIFGECVFLKRPGQPTVREEQVPFHYLVTESAHLALIATGKGSLLIAILDNAQIRLESKGFGCSLPEPLP